MNKLNIDNSGVSRLLELVKSGRQRKIARLYYMNNMSINEICDQIGCNSVIALSDIAVINKLIQDNIKIRTCCDCKKEYYTAENGRKCTARKERTRKETLELRKSIKIAPNKPPERKFKSIQTVEKEREQYNKKHNTHLSYGQFVGLMGE